MSNRSTRFTIAIALSASLAAVATQAPLSVAAATQSTISCARGDITASLQAAVAKGGTVHIGPGTCALSDRISVRHAVTIDGAGATRTFIVQHAKRNIFEITAPGTTVENVNLDTATYHTRAMPVLHDPDPGVLYSNVSNTTVRNVTAETGNGYGIRLVGPEPCVRDVNAGEVVANVTMTTTGTGGFAAIDISCQHQATLTGITVHGGIVAFFHDQNVTMNGEIFSGGPRAIPCAHPWYITGPANNISITNVVSNSGHGVIKQPASNITVTNQRMTKSGC